MELTLKAFPTVLLDTQLREQQRAGSKKLTLLLDAISKYDWKQVPFYADITRLSPKSIERLNTHEKHKHDLNNQELSRELRRLYQKGVLDR